MLAAVSGNEVSYANNKNLSNLNVAIDDGIGVLIGPNGVGKSTLIGILEGLVRVNHTDRVSLLGESPYKKPELAFRNVSFLPEKPVNLGGRSVLEAIKYFSMLREISAEKFQKLLSYFDIEYVLRQKWKDLSNGEIQIISIILCLSVNAKLYVMDEPNANLDFSNRIKLSKIISRLRNEEHSSFLITSHILDEILPISDYIISMNKNSVSSTVLKGDYYKKNNLIIVKSFQIEELYDKVKINYNVKLGQNELIVRNTSTKELIDLLGNKIDLVTGIEVFPYFLSMVGELG
jgi:ABC-2 type transport system ATP-binding protein